MYMEMLDHRPRSAWRASCLGLNLLKSVCMAKFVRIKDLELLKEYAAVTERHVGVLFPLEYLQRSEVYVLLERRRIQGGFVIVPEAPFRVIDSLPEEVLANHSFFNEVHPRRVCELTALWLSPQARKKGYSFWLWARAYFEMLRSGKSHFVYAYAMKKAHLKKIFAEGSPQVLFRGETKILPGMSLPEVESVEAIHIWTMAFVPFIRPGFFLGRLRSGQGALKHPPITKEA